MRLGVEAAVVDGELVAGDIETVDDEVTAVGLTPRGNGIALPGFIDIHTHGYDAVDFAHGSVEDLGRASSGLTATGVTGFQPTLLTLESDDMLGAAKRHSSARYPGARFLGTHLEGPFLSRAHHGAHEPRLLQLPDVETMRRLLEAGSIGQVTIAPELPGASEVIDLLVARNVVVAVGHSDASAREAHEAFDRGARVLTHVFNASRPFRHRDPGVVGVALTRGDVYVTAVVDNVHLSREATLLAMQVGPARFVVVTDAMEAAGQGDGIYTLGNREVTVKGGEARLADGTIASSVLTMDGAFRNLTELGWSVSEAAAAVSTSAADALSRPDLGRISVGGRADIVVLDDAFEVKKTLIEGSEVYAA